MGARWWRRAGLVTLLLILVAAGMDLVRWQEPTRPIGSMADTAPSPAPPGRSPDGPDPATPRADPPAGRPGAGDAPASDPRGGAAGHRILVGANVQVGPDETWQEANARADASYGPLQLHRVFYPDLPPAWPGSRAEGDGRPVVVSFKADPGDLLAGGHDAHLAEWFRTAPRDRDVYWTYFHEPEDEIESGQFRAADFRAAWRHLAGLAKAADNRRLHATLVLMCWTLEPGSGRDWRDYYPGRDVIAVLGWDCYNSGGQRDGTYPEPADRFGAAIEVSRAEGKPWGVAELGSELVPGDDSGHQRGAWLRQIGRYLAEHPYPPLWVAYFDSTVGGDFRLRDRPSQQAWQDFARAGSGG